MARLMTQVFAAVVGIDWADISHAVCLQVASSDTQESSVLAHTPEAIGTRARTLRAVGPYHVDAHGGLASVAAIRVSSCSSICRTIGARSRWPARSMVSNSEAR
jgi:hypothetical protein